MIPYQQEEFCSKQYISDPVCCGKNFNDKESSDIETSYIKKPGFLGATSYETERTDSIGEILLKLLKNQPNNSNLTNLDLSNRTLNLPEGEILPTIQFIQNIQKQNGLMREKLMKEQNDLIQKKFKQKQRDRIQKKFRQKQRDLIQNLVQMQTMQEQNDLVQKQHLRDLKRI